MICTAASLRLELENAIRTVNHIKSETHESASATRFDPILFSRMSWITVIWSLAAGACLTLGSIHFLVWCWDRTLRANLWFSLTAFSVAFVAAIEWTLMRSATIPEFLSVHQLGHLATFFTILGLVLFVQLYFGTGRRWLGYLLIALRALVLILAFVPGPTFNFRELSGLIPLNFLGEIIVVPKGVPTPWARLGELSLLILVGFVIDASVTLWKKGEAGERRRALVVGGGVVLFFSACIVNVLLIHTGVLPMPYFITFHFLFLVAAMGFELSRDLVRAGRMAEELRENAESMTLAAESARLALWRWDVIKDDIWVSPNGRALYEVPAAGPITLGNFLDSLHPDDREATRNGVKKAELGDGLFQAEYRVVLRNGGTRWIAARGRFEKNSAGQTVRMRGVSIDVTDRRRVEAEAEELRAELTHLARITTLSELSGSITHEITQPLAIILSNTQAARRFLSQESPDLAEVDEILSDVASEAKRAGEVIRGLRSLMKRCPAVEEPVELNEAINEVLRLIESDLVGRGVVVRKHFAADLPVIHGDRVQLQQVVLNLLLNGAEAMAENAEGDRHLIISTAVNEGAVRLSISDAGYGLPVEMERIFEPFFSTRANGLGLGLAICRSIVDAHRGHIRGVPNEERGATFYVDLPT